MDFRDYAAKETTTVVNRLLAGTSESSLQQLKAFRAALDAALGSLETTLGQSPQAAADLADLIDRLAKAATDGAEDAARVVAAEARRTADQLHARIDDQTTEIESLTALLREADGRSDGLRIELDDERARADAARHEAAEERTRTESVRAELAEALDAQHQTELARIDLEAARDEQALLLRSTEDELRSIRELIDATRGELADTSRELSKVSDDLELTLIEKAKLEDAASVAQSQAQAAEVKLAAVTDLFKTNAARVKALERTERLHERTIHDLESKLRTRPAGGPGGRASLSMLDELLSAFRALAGATTIGDVLATLTEHLAAEFARVALFRVNGNRLEGVHQIGFDLQGDIGKVVVPLGMDSLLAKAVASGQLERLSGAELTDTGTPFGGAPDYALALPVVVNGETLGIVYADGSDAAASERGEDALDLSTRVADALAQHAAALLTRMTIELKALAELRAYASSLLSEIEQMYASDVSAGKSGQDLQNRLKANVEYARSIYANRAALESSDAAGLLDDQITAMIEGQRTTAFARDLAAVVGRTELLSNAEAS